MLPACRAPPTACLNPSAGFHPQSRGATFGDQLKRDYWGYTQVKREARSASVARRLAVKGVTGIKRIGVISGNSGAHDA